MITASMNYPYRYGVNSVLLNNRGQTFLDSEFILGVEPRRGATTAMPWFKLDCADKDQLHLHCNRYEDNNLRPGKRQQQINIWGAVGSRSAAIFDLDQDGDLDIVTNEFNAQPMVLISNLSARQPLFRFVKVSLLGSTSNRSGLGATVIIKTAETNYTKVHDGKSGYLSQSLLPLYFGLGATEKIDHIEVHWPSGYHQFVTASITPNTHIVIKEP